MPMSTWRPTLPLSGCCPDGLCLSISVASFCTNTASTACHVMAPMPTAQESAIRRACDRSSICAPSIPAPAAGWGPRSGSSTPTKQMWDAMSACLNQGGRLMYMGANGWYRKIAYHPTVPGVIEVRRSEGGICTWAAEPGEYYYSFTGEYGGLWRRQGRPPQVLVGIGFTAQGFDISAPYHRLPDSFSPCRVHLCGNWRRRADRGLWPDWRGAAGLELDRADRQLGTPPML